MILPNLVGQNIAQVAVIRSLSGIAGGASACSRHPGPNHWSVTVLFCVESQFWDAAFRLEAWPV